MRQKISSCPHVNESELSSILQRVIEAENDIVEVIRVSDFKYNGKGDYYASYLIVYVGESWMGKYISKKIEDED